MQRSVSCLFLLPSDTKAVRIPLHSCQLGRGPDWALGLTLFSTVRSHLKPKTHLAPSAFPLDFKKSCLIEGKLTSSGFDSFTLNLKKQNKTKQYFEDLVDAQEEF